MLPPVAPKRPHAMTQHGQTRVDEYFWMRNREDPAVMEYLKAENDYLEQALLHTKPLQKQLYLEMKARIKEDDSTVPEREDDYFYYKRSEAGRQYPIHCRKHGSLEAPEEILLDVNLLAEGKTFCRLHVFAPSPDHQKLAYSVDFDGAGKCRLFVKDLVKGTLLPEVIQNTTGWGRQDAVWANDNRTLFYVTMDEALRGDKVWRHTVGTDPAGDSLACREVDTAFTLGVSRSRSGAYVLAHSSAKLTDEWRILSTDEPDGEFRVFSERRRGVEYRIEHSGRRFFVVTNDDARSFRLMATPQEGTSRGNWQEVIPHRADVLLESALAFENHLVLVERKDGLIQLRISAADGLSEVRYVPFPEPAYDAWPMTNPEFTTDRLRLHYSSFITPDSVVDFHFATGEWELKKQQEIPSGHDPQAYAMERLSAAATDGTMVPMAIVYRKGMERDGRNPTLLHGYGSYGYSTDVEFNSNRFSLIDRGFIYAIAQVRGGSELGRAWYEDGRLLKKRNTFTDFIACAEHLIARGYTSRERLAILGGSAGGLLVGACLTMRPDLFRTVVAKAPFVDVVTTMSDPTIPLTTLEYDEWGNPADKAFFDYMMSYSPYDNIRMVAYPDVLLTTGLHDSSVAYWEPAKFAARLRGVKIGPGLVLLKTNMSAGHAGASGRYDYLREVALDYAFLLDRLGVAV